MEELLRYHEQKDTGKETKERREPCEEESSAGIENKKVQIASTTRAG